MNYGLVELSFPSAGGGDSPVCATLIDEDVSIMLSNAGYDPAEINTIKWPAVGFNNYATCKFLVDNYSAEMMSYLAPTIINFNDVIFEDMYLKSAVPVFLNFRQSGQGSNNNSFYILEFVDARFFNTIGFSDGFHHGVNITMPEDRSKFLYASTDYGYEYQPVKVLDMLGSELHPAVSNKVEFEAEADSRLLDNLNLRDIHYGGQSIGEWWDNICTESGLITLAYPSLEDSSYYYKVRAVGMSNDASSASTFYAAMDRAKYGGLLPSPNDGSFVVGERFGKLPQDMIAGQVPGSVSVYFPKSVRGENYPKDTSEYEENIGSSGDFNYTTDRYTHYTTNTGRPSIGGWMEDRLVIHSSLHADWELLEDEETEEITPVLKNESDLVEMANNASVRYYSRFYTSPINVTFPDVWGRSGDGADLGNLVLWSGCQMIIWDMTPNGPRTILSGDYDHPLFGHSRESRVLTTNDIVSVGGVRATPQASGRVILDTVSKEGLYNVHHAVITKRSGDVETGWLYDAESLSDPETVRVVDKEPNRDHDPTKVDIIGLNPGDYCMIGVIPPNSEGARRRTDTKTSNAGSGIINRATYPNVSSSGNMRTTSAISINNPRPRLKYKNLSNEQLLYRQANTDPLYGGRPSGRARVDNDLFELYVWEKPKTVECEQVDHGSGQHQGYFGGFGGLTNKGMGGY